MRTLKVYSFGLAWLVLTLILAGGWVNSCRENSRQMANHSAQLATIIRERDKEGRETASKPAQEATAKEVMQQDTKLAAAVKRQGKRVKSATVISLETEGEVPAIPSPDPADTTSLYFKDDWIEARVWQPQDSLRLSYRVRNELEVFQVEMRRGLFKPPELEVKVRNLNPHTTTTELESFSVKLPKRRAGLWIGIGFGAGVAATAYLLR